jgi:hypothetical protein
MKKKTKKIKKYNKEKFTIKNQKKKHKSSKKSNSQSLLNSFLNKKTKRINSLFNNKDIIEMLDNYQKEDDNTFTKETDRCMCIDYDVMGNDYNMENNQDYRRCKRKTYNGTDFCKTHQNCTGFLSQSLNGSEVDYNPPGWSNPYIEGTHNCYSYFLNDRQDSIKKKCDKICKKKYGSDCPKKIKECGDLKPQPGDHALLMKEGDLKNKEREYKCPKMEEKIKQDNPSIKKSSFLEKCPKKHYKGAMVVADDHTFHFYRQNADASWSHKPGTQKVVNKDAGGRKIHIPHFANRDYSHKPNKIKYNSFCNYYCIPTNKHIKTNSI